MWVFRTKPLKVKNFWQGSRFRRRDILLRGSPRFFSTPVADRFRLVAAPPGADPAAALGAQLWLGGGWGAPGGSASGGGGRSLGGVARSFGSLGREGQEENREVAGGR